MYNRSTKLRLYLLRSNDMTTKEKNKDTYKRIVLFLYPNAEEIPDKAIVEKIENLVDSLYYIIRKANEFVSRAFSSNVFVNSKYIPVIEAQAINKVYDEVAEEDIHGLRLCVTSIDDFNCSDMYSGLISKKKLDENDISHLLSIKLFSKSKRYSWKESENENFSALIETGVNELTKIIICIMLDIALYHYFKLPKGLVYRQSFGLKKKEFLDESLSNNEIKSVFGSSDAKRSNIKYLSISLSYIDAIDKEPQKIKSLLDAFTDFYYKHVIPDALIDINSGKIDFSNGSKEIPVDEEDVQTVQKLVNELSDSEMNEIIEQFKSELSDESGAVTSGAEQKIILLLSDSDKNIFPYLGSKRRKFLVKKDMNPSTYINLEDFYILFHLVSSDIDEV